MKNKIKIATDLEQSKKLLELGIDLNTSDMFYEKMDDEEYDYYKLGCGKVSKTLMVDFGYIPAWSLSALMNILPKGCVLIKDSVNEKYHLYSKGYIPCKCISAENPIDALFEMIVYLKENKML